MGVARKQRTVERRNESHGPKPRRQFSVGTGILASRIRLSPNGGLLHHIPTPAYPLGPIGRNIEDMEHGLIGREVFGKKLPRTAGPYQIEQGVNHDPKRCPGPAIWRRLGQHGLQVIPLSVGEVGGEIGSLNRPNSRSRRKVAESGRVVSKQNRRFIWFYRGFQEIFNTGYTNRVFRQKLSAPFIRLLHEAPGDRIPQLRC